MRLFSVPMESKMRAARRRLAKPHSSSNLLRKAEHGAASFQRLHRFLYKSFVIDLCLSQQHVVRLSKKQHVTFLRRLAPNYPSFPFGKVRAALARSVIPAAHVAGYDIIMPYVM